MNEIELTIIIIRIPAAADRLRDGGARQGHPEAGQVRPATMAVNLCASLFALSTLGGGGGCTGLCGEEEMKT